VKSTRMGPDVAIQAGGEAVTAIEFPHFPGGRPGEVHVKRGAAGRNPSGR